MRLLETTDGYAFNLTKKFEINDIPPYAILSHTWEANQEVTFDELVKTDQQGIKKAHASLRRLRLRFGKTGYNKIRFCAQRAHHDGLRYFWVDTCCINKNDGTELQHAINSMFRWYQDAAKCYVYLSDVSTAPQRREGMAPAWQSAFERSRWFTRGWTLQELLAPAVVEFYSQEGIYLGTRLELKQHIHHVTNISLRALSGAPLNEFSVDERLSWAAERKTTHKEDEVYALLGIFGVHLPFIYGERYENALRRLHEEIAISQAVPVGQDCRAKREPMSTVPFRRDTDFITRDGLDVLHHMLAKPAARAALVGLGGVGKSQIAVEYTYQMLEQLPKPWVFWVHAGTQARFTESYREIAKVTKMVGWDDPRMNHMQLVRTWLQDESNGRWVMVVDNADDANVFFSDVSQTDAIDPLTSSLTEPFASFLPQTTLGSILFTSRNRDVAYRLMGSDTSVVEIGPMNNKDALALLQKKFNFGIKTDEADALICALGAMPLALTQAAAFINRRAPRMSISKYVKEVQRSDSDRARLLNEDLGDIRRDHEASNSIMTTWQISFKHIRERAPAAARLLALMSFFDPQEIPDSLLPGKYGGHENEASDFEDDIYTLTSFSLVKASADGSNFEMHGLVQYSMKHWLKLNQELEYWKECYVVLIDERFPLGGTNDRTTCQALFPHAQTALDDHPFGADALEAWASISWKAGWYIGGMGEYRKAYKLALDSLDVREILLGPEDPDTLDSLNSVGVALSKLGRYAEAKTMYQRAVEAMERILGAEHLDTLTSMLNLAIVYTSEGHYGDAEKLFEQILERANKIESEAGSLLTLSTLTALAVMHADLGHYEEAEDMELRILKAYETKLGVDHPTTLAAKVNLACTYENQGRLKEAKDLYLQALRAHELNRDAETHILAIKAPLSSIYRQQGQWAEAENLQLQILDAQRTRLGPDHPITLHSMSNLASTYWFQDRFSEAEALDLQVLNVRKATLGEDHPSTLNTKSNLAALHWKQDRFPESEALWLEVLNIRRATLGEDHPLTLANKAGLASTYRDQGRFKEAEQLEEYVLRMRKKKLGDEHTCTLGSMGNLAVTYRRQGYVEKAYSLMEECYQRHIRVSGADHPLTVRYKEGLEKWRRQDAQAVSEGS